MTLAPKEVYPKAHREPGDLGHVSHTAITLHEVIGGQALPDARLTTEERALVKRVIAQLEQRLSVDGLMFAAAGCEDAAKRKRAAEKGGRA